MSFVAIPFNGDNGNNLEGTNTSRYIPTLSSWEAFYTSAASPRAEVETLPRGTGSRKQQVSQQARSVGHGGCEVRPPEASMGDGGCKHHGVPDGPVLEKKREH